MLTALHSTPLITAYWELALNNTLYMCKSKLRKMDIEPRVEPPATGSGVLYLSGAGAARRGPGVSRAGEHLLLYWYAHQINAGTVLT